MHDEQSTTGNRQGGKALSVRRSCLFVLSGFLVVAVAAAIIAVILARGKSLPELRPDEFDLARKIWQEKKPIDYVIETSVSGLQAATYEVVVEGGQVVSSLRNGFPLTDRRTWGTWTVDGMFRTMESDVDRVRPLSGERPAPAGQAGSPRLTLRVMYDPAWGYPSRYLRFDWQNQVQVTWQVRRFEIDPSADKE